MPASPLTDGMFSLDWSLILKSVCVCVYLIVEDDHDKHTKQHRLHEEDDVMRPETKRRKLSQAWRFILKTSRHRSLCLTLSGVCWASPRFPSLRHRLARSLFSTPTPTPPAPWSTGWPYLRTDITSQITAWESLPSLFRLRWKQQQQLTTFPERTFVCVFVNTSSVWKLYTLEVFTNFTQNFCVFSKNSSFRQAVWIVCSPV